jgi:hypothetical protein
MRSLIRSIGDLWLACRMLAWAMALPVLKRVVPLPRLVRLAGAARVREVRSSRRETQVVALAQRLCGPLARRDGGCLSRSLLGYRFLGQAGARPKLIVGVRKEGDRVLAHAWLTVDDRIVNDTEENVGAYRPILTSEPH